MVWADIHPRRTAEADAITARSARRRTRGRHNYPPRRVGDLSPPTARRATAVLTWRSQRVPRAVGRQPDRSPGRSVARSVRRHALGPRLAARWRAPGCAKLRRGAPRPRLNTELAAPGANRRTMLRHGAVRPQACELTHNSPAGHGWPDVLPRRQGSPGKRAPYASSGATVNGRANGRSSWSRPRRCPRLRVQPTMPATQAGKQSLIRAGRGVDRAGRVAVLCCCTRRSNCSNFSSDLWS